MRKLLVLCGTILCLTLTAAAQDAPAAFDASDSTAEAAAPVTFEAPNRPPWQLVFNYQYQHFKILGQSFSDNGYNTDFTRYLTDWFGIEGTAVVGFGNTGAPYNIREKSFFIGGGPHITWPRAGRFEPWGHVLTGWEHFRFAQTNKTIGLGSNSAIGFRAGGGVDVKVFPRAYLRFQGDVLGSHFGSTRQANYSFGAGMVLNF
jgi:hypothetical protein